MTRRYTDEFRSTAPYYARFRPPYPPALFDLLASRFELDGSGRLLDLGCGTGQLAVPLARYFEEVVAMDPEPEMLAEAAAAGGPKNIRWMARSSDALANLGALLGTFRLVTIGNAFHWMDRDAVLRDLYPRVIPGGAIAIIGSGGEDSRWDPAGTPDMIDAVIKRWLGPVRRAGSGKYEPPAERHEEIVRRSRFLSMEIHSVTHRWEWDIDSVVGSLYSTSYASPFVLGDRREGFEGDLRTALAALSPSGKFLEEIDVHAILAWKP